MARFNCLTLAVFMILTSGLLSGCERRSAQTNFDRAVNVMKGSRPQASDLSFLGDNFHDLDVRDAQKLAHWVQLDMGRKFLGLGYKKAAILLDFPFENDCVYPASLSMADIDTARVYDLGNGYSIYVGFLAFPVSTNTPIGEVALFRNANDLVSWSSQVPLDTNSSFFILPGTTNTSVFRRLSSSSSR